MCNSKNHFNKSFKLKGIIFVYMTLIEPFLESKSYIFYLSIFLKQFGFQVIFVTSFLNDLRTSRDSVIMEKEREVGVKNFETKKKC